MTDLYKTLGVSWDATPEEISAAYRRAAKEAHPDAGGTDEAFTALVVAKRILSDKDKRAQYDETGRVDDQPDAKQSRALETVASIITQLIELPDAIYVNVIDQAIGVVDAEVHKQIAAKHKAEADLTKNLKMRARFKAKPGKVDRIGILLDNRASAIREVMSKMDEQLDVLNLAKELLADQTFDVEPPRQQGFWQTANNIGVAVIGPGSFR